MRKILSIMLLLYSIGLNAQIASNISLLGQWNNSSLPASSAYANIYNEVWGYEGGGREYAIIGSTMGTHVIDVTDPTQPVEADFIPGAATGTSIIHRDYKTYGNYLYMVCDEGASTLQIADLSYLPDSVHVVYDFDLFARSHNIFIDVDQATLYVCGGSFNLKIYSLSNPTSPSLLLDCKAPDIPWWTAINHVHDLYVQNDTAYLHAGDDGFFVVDFSNMAAPAMIGNLSIYPFNGYNHSGWPDYKTMKYYFADENHGFPLKVCDISDLSDISYEDSFSSEVDENSIPHNLFVKDDLLYVSYYHDGLQVFNISDPSNIWKAGYYDTYTAPDHSSYRGAWGVYPYLNSGIILVSDMQSGLFVLNASPNLSINEEKKVQVILYPNPAHNTVKISYGSSGPAMMKIHDLQGRLILKEFIQNETDINVNQLVPGIYLFSIDLDEKTETIKLIVE